MSEYARRIRNYYQDSGRIDGTQIANNSLMIAWFLSIAVILQLVKVCIAVYRYLHSVVDFCHLHTSMPYDRLKWEGTTFAWRKDWGEREHLPGHCQKFGNCYPEDKKDDRVLAREKVGTLQRPNGSRGPRGIFSNL
jgi:hypothetical protein